jgi:virulence-associated protein VapD
MSNNNDVISFTRKADDNPNVTIIKKFGKPTKYLDQYIQGTEMWKEINKFNLFYVLQTKLSIEDSVFKVGVSAGERRLKDYLSHNGKTNRIKKGGWVMGSKEDEDSCRGVFLWYLAGQRDKVRNSKNKKESQIVKDYYKNPYWSNKHEKIVKKTLKGAGFKTIQGSEWFVVDDLDKMKLFKQIVTQLTADVEPEPLKKSTRQGRGTTNKYKDYV